MGAGGGRGIYTGSGGATTTIADSDSPVSSSFAIATPSINGSGTVAFQASRDAGGSGLFVQNGSGGFDAVLLSGQSFMGSTVSSFGFGNQGFNDLGQFAFRATLADGRQGIYTATSSVTVAAPEPGTWAMMALGVGALRLVMRRKRRDAQA